MRNGRPRHLRNIEIEIFLAVARRKTAEIAAVPRYHAMAEVRTHGAGHLFERHLIVEHGPEDRGLLSFDFSTNERNNAYPRH